MIEAVLILALLAGIGLYFWGRSSAKSGIEKKNARIAKDQTVVASKWRKRDADGVADDIDQWGI